MTLILPIMKFESNTLIKLNKLSLSKKKEINYLLNQIFNLHNIKLCELKISYLKSLIYLNLSYYRFKFILDINSFDKLTYLDLSNNDLTEIPDIYNLSNLTFLDLSKNYIRKVETDLYLLSSLKELNLYYNRLDYILLYDIPYKPKCSASVNILKYITNLDLSSNGIKQIFNIDILHLKLRKLNLSYNYMHCIDKTITKLTNLTYLNLYHNYIPIIDINIPTLKYLNLSKNKIYKIPEDIIKLTKLKYLNFSKNNLDIPTIPEDIVKLTKLKFLDLSKNNIVIIPEDIVKLTKLKFLDLSKNNLNNIERLKYLTIKKLKL